jgi:hypothetical protein
MNTILGDRIRILNLTIFCSLQNSKRIPSRNIINIQIKVTCGTSVLTGTNRTEDTLTYISMCHISGIDGRQRTLWVLICMVPTVLYTLHKYIMPKISAVGLPWIEHYYCKLSNTIFFYGSTALRGPRPRHLRRFTITLIDTPRSVGLLWTRDQLVAETSTWHHTILTRDRHPCPRWDSNPRS